MQNSSTQCLDVSPARELCYGVLSMSPNWLKIGFAFLLQELQRGKLVTLQPLFL